MAATFSAALNDTESSRVLGLYKVGIVGITGVVADPRMVLAVALKIAAVSIVVAQNHPSGNLRPGKADEDLTCKLKDGGKLLDVKMLHHLIVAPDGEAASHSLTRDFYN